MESDRIKVALVEDRDDEREALLEAIKELHEGGAPMSPPIAQHVIDAFHESCISGLCARTT